MSKKILVVHGPNLNLLGTREPQIYGTETLAQIDAKIAEKAQSLGLVADSVQSNAEGDIIAAIQGAVGTYQGIIINAAAFTHTSIGIAYALAAVGLPVIEVHLSNIYRREEFRHQSYISGVALGVLCGFGSKGYTMAVEALSDHI